MGRAGRPYHQLRDWNDACWKRHEFFKLASVSRVGPFAQEFACSVVTVPIQYVAFTSKPELIDCAQRRTTLEPRWFVRPGSARDHRGGARAEPLEPIPRAVGSCSRVGKSAFRARVSSEARFAGVELQLAHEQCLSARLEQPEQQPTASHHQFVLPGRSVVAHVVEQPGHRCIPGAVLRAVGNGVSFAAAAAGPRPEIRFRSYDGAAFHRCPPHWARKTIPAWPQLLRDHGM